MISVKLNPDNPHMSVQTKASINVQIKLIKNCLKQDYLYTDEEIHQLKKELRSLTEQRNSLKVNNGFANWTSAD